MADAQALLFEDMYFDYIVSCECLEHVPRPPKMLANLYRCLKSKGGFILTTENYFNAVMLVWLKSWLTRQPFNSDPMSHFDIHRIRPFYRHLPTLLARPDSNA